MAPPRAICCSICCEIQLKVLGQEEIWIDQRRLAQPLTTDNPGGKTKERNSAADQDRQHVLSALLPDQDAEHDAAHAQDGEEPPTTSTSRLPRIRHVMHHLDAEALRR